MAAETPLDASVKINAVPDAVTRWIVGRASSFDPRGKPHWTYARIAYNLKRSRVFKHLKLDLNERQIRRVVERERPAVYQARADTRRRTISPGEDLELAEREIWDGTLADGLEPY